MRSLDRRWQYVAKGCNRAEQLETKLRDSWQHRIQEAEGRRFEKARAAWQARQAASRREFEEQLNLWRLRDSARRSELELQKAIWARELSDGRQRLRKRARFGLSLGLLVLVVLAPILLAAPVLSYFLAAVAVLSLALLPALASWEWLRRRQGEEPSPDPADDPEPQPPATGPEPRPDPADPVPLNITQKWWDKVAYNPRTPRPEQTHGDEGVEDFCNDLVAELPDTYFAVRDLLVRRKLDVDVLVVGPTGIWVFEVKYWTGEITCHRGEWHKTTTWYGPGGYEESKEKDMRSPDRQWLREKVEVEKTLQRLPGSESLLSAIQGGIVFSHPDGHWDIDGSCESAYGGPDDWTEAIRSSPSLPQFTLETRLRVLEGLLKWTHRIDQQIGPVVSCSVELAETLFANATREARAYVEAGS
jgi:hypothetical protein